MVFKPLLLLLNNKRGLIEEDFSKQLQNGLGWQQPGRAPVQALVHPRGLVVDRGKNRQRASGMAGSLNDFEPERGQFKAYFRLNRIPEKLVGLGGVWNDMALECEPARTGFKIPALEVERVWIVFYTSGSCAQRAHAPGQLALSLIGRCRP